ncbi:MAG: hypothetical protein WBM53_15800 [Maribacter sp.]
MIYRSRKDKHLSRRGILPILGSTFLIPFLGFGRSFANEIDANDEEYQTLLKPDGTAVKVKVSAIKKSKIIKRNISNTSFLNWLGKKM